MIIKLNLKIEIPICSICKYSHNCTGNRYEKRHSASCVTGYYFDIRRGYYPIYVTRKLSSREVLVPKGIRNSD